MKRDEALEAIKSLVHEAANLSVRERRGLCRHRNKVGWRWNTLCTDFGCIPALDRIECSPRSDWWTASPHGGRVGQNQLGVIYGRDRSGHDRNGVSAK